MLLVDDLKQIIMEFTNIPVCRQQLKGIGRNSQSAHIGATVLKSLKLPKENNIFLTDLSAEGLMDDAIVVPETPPAMYQLRVQYTNEERELVLNFPGSRTILDIKNDVHAVLKVPVRFQRWVGWPADSDNTTKLSETGFEAVHSLQLTRDTERTLGSNSSNNHINMP